MPDSLKILFRRIQGGMEGLADALLGDRAERLLDEDIRDLDDALYTARGQHAAAKAQRIANDQHLATVKADISRCEADIDTALRRRQASRARTLALDVVRLQNERVERVDVSVDLSGREHQFSHVMEQLESRLRRLKHQLDILRASNSLQRAQAIVARRRSGDASPHPEPAFVSVARFNRKSRVPVVDNYTITEVLADPVDDPTEAVLARAKKRVRSVPAKRRTKDSR